jgi:hypothetical protein
MVQTRNGGSKQRTRQQLQMDRAAIDRMYPTLPQTAERYVISRARNGTGPNPLSRIATWFQSARDSGMDSRVADEAIAYLMALRDEVWADEHLDVEREMERRAELTHNEYVWALRAARDPRRYEMHVQALDEARAQNLRLRRAELQAMVTK